METTIGYLAAFCTTIAFIPQAIKVYKSKHTKDISMGMFLLMNAGLIFWLIYGIMIFSYPIIWANAVTIIFAFYILIMKIKIDFLSTLKDKKS
ncbi:MAG TPA: SemiSWEET transporter [Ignavibacteriaceae bacterium]|jgi:MtN3 and saliva related transmembrane protein|nr:SemiSWEET transporter [Ignavibacteriaceae bacterium]